MSLFGTEGLINHLTLIFGAVFALGGLIFRKSVANDLLDIKFSFIGCMVVSMLVFIIMDVLFDNLKVLVVVSLLGWLAGGYFGGLFLWDGYAEGNE
jgi:tellurite resistance protein TehA-like permease